MLHSRAGWVAKAIILAGLPMAATGIRHVLRGPGSFSLVSVRYDAGRMSKNGWHHAIPRHGLPLEADPLNFFLT